MVNSFQHEIHKSRINITVDIETNGARKKKELPLKFLILGDFSLRENHRAVADRERHCIAKNNFDQVMKELSPEFKCDVENKIKNDGSSIKVNLKLDAMRKFTPESIVNEVPELRRLLAMRHLLKDLKANILDNTEFRKGLEKIVKDKDEVEKLYNQLQMLEGISKD